MASFPSVPYLLMYLASGYLCGSIQFGLIWTRFFSLGNLRKIGSGNTGTTNVLRTGHKLAAFLTLVGDVTKGWFPIWLCSHVLCPKHLISQSFGLWIPQNHVLLIAVALASILGHIFPIWTQFKGGKGVATTFGCFLALFPADVIPLALSWILIFLLTRISSVASLVTFCGVSPILGGITAFHSQSFNFFMFTLLCALIIGFTHTQNIKRLLSGQEKVIRLQTNRQNKR